MNLRAGLSALIVTALLTFSGCSAPPIAAEVSQDLQSEVQQIAVLTARGDTADAVAAAHDLAARVRAAQADGQITNERAVIILQRVEQLINRLVRSGAAPAPADMPQPLAGPVVPVTPPSADPAPTETEKPEPTAAPEAPETPDPVETPDPPETPEESPEPDPNVDGDSSGSGSGNSGSDSGSGSGVTVPVPILVDAANDDDDDDGDDGGKGRGRGRSGGD